MLPLIQVHAGADVFVESALAIKQPSSFKTTLVIELPNAIETMYVPTRAAYAGGSYEVTNSAVEADQRRCWSRLR